MPEGVSFAYDDGNGLWITSGETPSDQDFFRCASPQDYTDSQVLSSGANQARGLKVSVEATPVFWKTFASAEASINLYSLIADYAVYSGVKEAEE